MPTNVDCPSCSRKLRVPDELLGKKVKCPTCSTTFTAGAAAPPPAPAEEERVAARRPAPQPAEPDEEETEDEREERRPRRRRSGEHLQPHRGTMILVLGIMGLVTGLGFILGPIAWLMGNNERRCEPAGWTAKGKARQMPDASAG